MKQENSRDYRVVPASELKRHTRRSPMKIIRDSVSGDYWITQEVADHVNVNIETIRRITRKVGEDGKKMLKAPTSAVRSGEAIIYLYTMEDVQEIEKHFEDRGYVLKNKVNPKKTLKEQTP